MYMVTSNKVIVKKLGISIPQELGRWQTSDLSTIIIRISVVQFKIVVWLLFIHDSSQHIRRD